MNEDVFNSKLPNLKHLSYLLALEKHKHFNRAAQACFVSQSTLSSAILKLEEQLSCQLLERDHKSFIFTNHGKQVINLARQLLLNANELVAFAKQQGGAGTGSIRVGCIPTIAPFLLTDIAQQWRTKEPKLDLFFCEDTTENLMQQLEQGEIDCAILAFPIQKHNFSMKLLGKDKFYIAGDKELISKLKKSFNYNVLPKKSIFLLKKEHCLTEHAVSACQLADTSRINSFSASSLATLVQMTSFHQGVTFLPKMAIEKGFGKPEGLSIQAIPGDVYREIGMVWRKTSVREQAFHALGEVASSLIGK